MTNDQRTTNNKQQTTNNKQQTTANNQIVSMCVCATASHEICSRSAEQASRQPRTCQHCSFVVKSAAGRWKDSFSLECKTKSRNKSNQRGDQGHATFTLTTPPLGGRGGSPASAPVGAPFGVGFGLRLHFFAAPVASLLYDLG
jgi:hypothetical protein